MLHALPHVHTDPAISPVATTHRFIHAQNGGIKAANAAGGPALAVTGDSTVTTAGTTGAALHVKASSGSYKGAVLKLEHAVGRWAKSARVPP